MGKHTKETLVVLDNTVLVNFGHIGRPDLVYEFSEGTACTTLAVMAEYQDGVLAADLQVETWKDLPVLYLTPSEEAFSLALSHRLGFGERTCLAVAVTRQAALASDDYLARQYAQRAGLPVIGTVGILVRAVQNGKIGLVEAQNLLDLMIAAGYHSPIRKLDEIL